MFLSLERSLGKSFSGHTSSGDNRTPEGLQAKKLGGGSLAARQGAGHPFGMKVTFALLVSLAVPALACSSRSSAPSEGTTTLEVAEPTDLNASLAKNEDDESRIYKQVRSRLPAVNYCYAKQRRIEPGLAGKIIVKITVAPAPQGSVVDAAITEKSLRSPAVETCVLGTVKGFAFQRKGKETLSMNLPFLFR